MKKLILITSLTALTFWGVFAVALARESVPTKSTVLPADTLSTTHSVVRTSIPPTVTKSKASRPSVKSRVRTQTDTLASVAITSPNGGEVLDATQPLTVTWNATGYTSAAIVNISLEFLEADGFSNSLLIPSTPTPNDGIQTYTLPTSTTTGQYSVRLQIREPGSPASVLVDRSDALFTIRQSAQTCDIDSFYASPTILNYGRTAYVHWQTTGCAYVYLGTTQVLPTGSANLGSMYQTTTVSLYASAQAVPVGCTSFLGFSSATGQSCAMNAISTPITIIVRS